MMYQNVVWLLFLGIIGLSIAIYSGFTLVELYQYSSLKKELAPQKITWSIHAYSIDSLAPQADYQYIYNGTLYSGQTIWPTRYLNTWSAEEATTKLSSEHHLVWINPSHPNDSSLLKEFPLKKTLYTGCLLLLLAYFIGLGRYVQRNTY